MSGQHVVLVALGALVVLVLVLLLVRAARHRPGTAGPGLLVVVILYRLPLTGRPRPDMSDDGTPDT